MKELSTEEKAKRYDKALERARIWKDKSGMPKDKQGILDDIFPELKESEDDEIRRWIINELKIKHHHLDEENVDFVDKAIAWLEKQGESYTKRDVDDAYLEGITVAKNEIEKQYEASYQIRKDIATFIFNYKGDIKDRAKWMDYLGIKASFVEKQGEQKPNPYSGTSFEYNGHTWGMCARDNGVEILMDSELKAFLSLEKSFIYPISPQKSLVPKSAMEAIKEEKVDNANKVVPKFKEGDWVVNNKFGDVWHIDSFDNKNYQVSNGKGNYNYFPISKQNEVHLYTTQDAKDGDVLATDNYIFIFKNIDDDGSVHYYCHYEIFKHEDDGQFGIAARGSIMGRTFSTQYSPATKEQREQLERAMYDAGYTFDFDKKELKKIEQKPAWSEEDEVKINRIVDCLENLSVADYDILLKDVDWLKSLKDRVGCEMNCATTWKPSDEQMKILNEVLNFAANHESPHWNDYIFGTLNNLIRQLKKLREK